MALVNHISSESRLPLTLSLSDSETKLFVRSRASAARPIRTNKAAANQPPVLKLCGEESYSKGRLRVSNWIVQRLNNDAVDQTVEP